MPGLPTPRCSKAAGKLRRDLSDLRRTRYQPAYSDVVPSGSSTKNTSTVCTQAAPSSHGRQTLGIRHREQLHHLWRVTGNWTLRFLLARGAANNGHFQDLWYPNSHLTCFSKAPLRSLALPSSLHPDPHPVIVGNVLPGGRRRHQDEGGTTHRQEFIRLIS